MEKDYGRPPRAEETRALVERRLKEAEAAGGVRETLTVDWRGKLAHFDVVEVPVSDLYYNPSTHRIRAQRSHEPERDAVLDADPWGAEGQAYLDHLLKALPADPARPDPDFGALKESLKEYGQSDPGLITRDGVLVNGNTRRAALMELYGPTHSMRVAVLPQSCDWADVAAVELSLQLRRDHRRDYSEINRLLAIDELASQGLTLAAIAATFRTTVAACQRDQWILACIRSLIERSENHGVRLPLVAFEDSTEKFRELYRKYQKEAAANPDKADLVLESRLAAIMLGFSKTDVRLIEADFRDRYLASRLPEKFREEPSAAASIAIPGLGRSVKGASATVVKARAITDAVLRARSAEAAGSGELGAAPDAVKTLNSLRDAMNDALVPAGKDSRIRKRKQAAPSRLADACQDIEQCVTDIVLSRGARSLDEEALDEAVLRLKSSLSKLAAEVKRTVAVPGDGAEWLISAMAEGE